MNFRLTLTALAFAFAAVPALAADCGGAVRFPAGQWGAVVTGALSGLESCDHTLSARKGQTLRAALDGSSLDLIAVEPVERDFASCDALVLDRDGSVTLRVLQTRAAPRQSSAAKPAATAMPLVPDQPEAVTVTGAHGVIIGRTRNDARKGGSRDFSAVLNVE